MHMDPIMPSLVAGILGILIIGMIMRMMKLPSIVGYLVSGIILGPYLMGIFSDVVLIGRLGGFGVVLLMFFVGMEMCIPCLIARWHIVVLGTLMQILASIGCVWIVGLFFDWPFSRIVLLGFVMSLSSTAVVIKLLEDSNEKQSHVGQNVIGILLTQDIAVIGMLIVLQFLRGSQVHLSELALQAVGAAITMALLMYISKKETIELPSTTAFQENSELQVFVALILCFGFAFILGLCHLSTAIGAFVGGILVTALKETRWVHLSLEPFRVVFIALFFVSIGMQLDLGFLTSNWRQIGLLVISVLTVNTFINALILRTLGETWRNSIYAGALLAQIGEFSFVIAAIGEQMGIIQPYGYQLALSTIAMTLLLTVFWTTPVRRWYMSLKAEPDK